MAELEQNLKILYSQPPRSHIDAPNTSIGHDVFEAVGDLPRAEEAVELDRPVGAGEEERREEPQESPERGHHQFQGWDYEVDPRFARSPAPTPEPQVNEQAENEDQAENRFVTRSGRQWGLASVNTNEDELDDFLGRPGQDEYHPWDVRIPLWSEDFSPHSLAALASQAVGGMESRSWKEASISGEAKQGLAAANDEMRSLIEAKVFHLVPRSITRGRVVTSMWVFKVKRQSDGAIERFKARLVARGFSQQRGIDFDETFAPIAKLQSIRLILALAAMNDLELHQMDVKTAFLYGSLDEKVFMEQPEGFEEFQDMVWQLDKSLYGLKQAPRAWHLELDTSLKALGFRRTISDHSIYTRDDTRGLIIVGVYVDDLTIASARLDTLVHLKSEMSKRYDVKDLGELHFILGLQVKRDRSARMLHLNQKQYVNTVLARFNMLDCKPAKSPLHSKVIMSLRKEGEEQTDRARYLTAVGSLKYAMLGTRPDLAYPVGLLGRFASDPSKTHWEGVLSVLKYLKHTSDLGITYSGGSDQLDGFSGFATSDPDRRRVTSGYVLRLRNNPPSRSQQGMQNMLPSLKLLES